MPADTFSLLPRGTDEPHDGGMSQIKGDTRPEDSIIDRYMLRASDAEREEARENLRRFVRLLIRVYTRLEAEKIAETIRNNRHSGLESESPPNVV